MKTWKTEDKTDWERGEWDNEPDKCSWTDDDTDLPCLIVRGPSGALCGYVGVDSSHPYFEVDYSQLLLNCHGGLTYSQHCQNGRPESEGICHVPENGKSDHVWWFGFDCTHYGDLTPKMAFYDLNRSGIYRNIYYVRKEVQRLAQQLNQSAGG